MLSTLKEIEDINFKEEVINNNGVVLVDFYADWCVPCKMLSQTMKQLSKEYDNKVKICKVNIEKASDTIKEYSINSVPSILMFKNGEMVYKYVGLQSKEDIEDCLERIING